MRLKKYNWIIRIRNTDNSGSKDIEYTDMSIKCIKSIKRIIEEKDRFCRVEIIKQR